MKLSNRAGDYQLETPIVDTIKYLDTPIFLFISIYLVDISRGKMITRSHIIKRLELNKSVWSYINYSVLFASVVCVMYEWSCLVSAVLSALC